MDFTKDIYINKEEVHENSEIVILYKGFLFSNKQSDDVYISYGYGNLWENKSEIKMKPTTFGYLATVKINNGENLQFCFRNSSGTWDNNNNQNYILPIQESDNILEFEPLTDTRKEVKIEISEIPNPLSLDKNLFETSVVTSDTISFENTTVLENSSKQVIPDNTVFTQISSDSNNQSIASESIVKSEKIEKSENNAYTEFSKITDEAKKHSVKAFDEDKVTAGSVYVNSLVKDIEESPLITGNLYIEKSLVPTPEKEMDTPTLFDKVKLAFAKIVKLIKSVLSPKEDED